MCYMVKIYDGRIYLTNLDTLEVVNKTVEEIEAEINNGMDILNLTYMSVEFSTIRTLTRDEIDLSTMQFILVTSATKDLRQKGAKYRCYIQTESMCDGYQNYRSESSDIIVSSSADLHKKDIWYHGTWYHFENKVKRLYYIGFYDGEPYLIATDLGLTINHSKSKDIRFIDERERKEMTREMFIKTFLLK